MRPGCRALLEQAWAGLGQGTPHDRAWHQPGIYPASTRRRVHGQAPEQVAEALISSPLGIVQRWKMSAALDRVSVWTVIVRESLRETVIGGKTFGVTPGVCT
jgi:hypothetical protein